MSQTERGRVTPGHLDELERWAYRHEQSWQMGINSYTLRAMIAEIREHRAEARSLALSQAELDRMRSIDVRDVDRIYIEPTPAREASPEGDRDDRTD